MAQHDDAPSLSEMLTTVGGEGLKELLRDVVRDALQELIEDELTTTIGAAKHQRTDTRTAQRNGSRGRLVSTPAGDVELKIPKLRAGSFFPELLEPRRRVDRALWAVIMTAYVTGTSTRKVDDLVKALGCDSGVSKSTVSRICTEIDEQVAVLRDRRLDHTTFPYVFVDATYVKARVNHQVVSRAVVIATGVTADGNREVLGVDVGDSEDELFWTAFLRSLRERGLTGTMLVISDAHAGLKAAITRVMQGAAWQRCRVHLMRNLLATVPKGQAEMVAALIRTIFAQTNADKTRAQLRQVATSLEHNFPKAAELLLAAEHDVTAYAVFPRSHWRKIWSTNPLERVNKEIKRRTNVVGVFPNDDAVLRLVGAVLSEVHDDWQVADRRYLSEGSMAALFTPPTEEIDTTIDTPQLPAA
jgi:putative transposase